MVGSQVMFKPFPKSETKGKMDLSILLKTCILKNSSGPGGYGPGSQGPSGPGGYGPGSQGPSGLWWTGSSAAAAVEVDRGAGPGARTIYGTWKPRTSGQVGPGGYGPGSQGPSDLWTWWTELQQQQQPLAVDLEDMDQARNLDLGPEDMVIVCLENFQIRKLKENGSFNTLKTCILNKVRIIK
ncbi:hypothetical protein AVEN_17412-1 [Araneus ventricosus]|uniref:Uncharacterized protein n=1 Tax=Araneus ventricosus TaxID=182803 RepID=A0A4Y2H2H6_ARAVE|nr:hypothetical protein AVEN_17412-1 [Araneus ventricosus]